MTTKTWVVLSTSNWRDYSFCTPLASLLWREVVGHEPFVLLAGAPKEWEAPKRNKVVLDFLFELGIQTKTVWPIAPYEIANISQNARQHASCYPLFEPADWIMLSDADLFPLKRDFYHQHETTNARIVSYYSNGNNFVSKDNVLSIADRRGEFQDLPTCHITMRTKAWRDLYALEPDGRIEFYVKRTLDAWLLPRMEGKAPSEAGWQAWMSDQRICTEKLCRADWFPSEVLLIPREGQPPRDRLDRGHPNDWSNLNVSRWTDCHTIRPADQEPQWSRVRPIFANLLPDRIARIDRFREEFVSGY